MPDPLHQRRVGASGQFIDQRMATVAIVGGEFHLDQLVVLERTDDFVNQRLADALATHLQDRLEAVRLTSKETGLGVGQDDRHKRHS